MKLQLLNSVLLNSKKRGCAVILKGNEDLRVVKTINGIKTAFEELICEKDYEKFTVKELCDRARINKKTFYHYYETMDYLLAEIQVEISVDYIKRIKDYNLPEDLEKVNREFFVYSAEQGQAYEKITCCTDWSSIRNKMVADVNDFGWSKSKKFQNLSDYEKKLLIESINNTVLSAYRHWVEDGKKMPLEDVIQITNRLVIGGTSGLFEK